MQTYAGLFRRVMASVIDYFVIFLLLSFIQFISGIEDDNFFYILLILFSWSYFAFQDSSSSQGTVGKHAMNIAVTDLNGNRISVSRATKRFVGKILAALPFFAGFLPVLFNKKRQGIHDKITKTLVVVRED
jgi:uncharacterized RDD family membrane protein YckC